MPSMPYATGYGMPLQAQGLTMGMHPQQMTYNLPYWTGMYSYQGHSYACKTLMMVNQGEGGGLPQMGGNTWGGADEGVEGNPTRRNELDRGGSVPGFPNDGKSDRNSRTRTSTPTGQGYDHGGGTRDGRKITGGDISSKNQG